MISRKAIVAASGAILFACIGAVSWQLLSNRTGVATSPSEATFAGSDVCAGCHDRRISDLVETLRRQMDSAPR
jgi:hypothetical protein